MATVTVEEKRSTNLPQVMLARAVLWLISQRGNDLRGGGILPGGNGPITIETLVNVAACTVSDQLPDDVTLFFGFAGDAVVNAGIVYSQGWFVDGRGGGRYIKTPASVQLGRDASVGVEGGISNAFQGRSVEFQAGGKILGGGFSMAAGGWRGSLSGAASLGGFARSGRIGVVDTHTQYNVKC